MQRKSTTNYINLLFYENSYGEVHNEWSTQKDYSVTKLEVQQTGIPDFHKTEESIYWVKL